MGTVPCEEKVHGVNSGDCDVSGIYLGAHRQSAVLHEKLRKLSGATVGYQHRVWSQYLSAPSGCVRVSFLSLRQYVLRNLDVKVRSPRIPPVEGDLLVHGRCQVTARACGEVAGNRRLQVQPGPVENIFRRRFGDTERFAPRGDRIRADGFSAHGSECAKSTVGLEQTKSRCFTDFGVI